MFSFNIGSGQSNSVGCDCQEVIYLNEPAAQAVIKLIVNPDGSLTEVRGANGGDYWYPDTQPSELSFNHGLATDVNGFLYIGASQRPGDRIRKFRCDGEIIEQDGSEIVIKSTLTNMFSLGNTVYTTNEAGIIAYDLCDGKEVGRVCYDDAGPSSNRRGLWWGLSYNPFTEVISATGSGNAENNNVYVFTRQELEEALAAPNGNNCIDPFIFENSSVTLANISPGTRATPIDLEQISGVSTDNEGNVYVTGFQNQQAPTYVLKYDNQGRFVTQANNTSRLRRARGLVYSPETDMIFIANEVDDVQFDCVSAYNASDLSYAGTALANPGRNENNAGKAMTLIKECCPISPTSTVQVSQCVEAGSVDPVFINEVYPCDGILCEGLWEVVNVDPGILFEDCNQSITLAPNVTNACATFVNRSEGGRGTQCGPFEVFLNIEFLGVPEVDLGDDIIVCQNNSGYRIEPQIISNSSNDIRYQWQRTTTGCNNLSGWTNIAGATQRNYTAPTNTQGVTRYRVLLAAQGDSGCVGGECEQISECIRIEVVESPSVNIAADDLAICLGETVDVTATFSGGLGSCAIQWQRRPQGGTWTNFATGQTTITASSGFLTVPGVYQYRARYDCDGPNCNEDVSNVVNIEVFADPSINIAADDIEVCLGESIDVTASVSGGTGSCDIQWQRRPQGGTWTDFSDGRTTITNGEGFLSAPGVYQYRARYNCNGPSCNEDVSNVINIEVFEDPTVSIESDDLAICLSESIDITASVSGGTGSCAIQWQRRPQGGTWTDFSDGRTTVTNGEGFLSAPGVYQYRARYNCNGPSCNEDVSNVVNVEVFADPSISIEADEIGVCLGEDVELTSTLAGGTGSCSIQWERREAGGTWAPFHNGEETVRAGLAFLDAPGVYQYRARYNCAGPSCDEDISNEINIEVFEDPSIEIAADDIEICLGEDVELSATLSGGTGSCAIQWQRREQGGTWTDAHSGETTVIAGTGFLSAAGVYEYRARYDCDGASCDEDVSDVIVIEVFEDPEVNIESDELIICLGESINVSAVVSGGTGDCAFQFEFRQAGGTWTNVGDGSFTQVIGPDLLSAPGIFEVRGIYNCDGPDCDEDISDVVEIEVFGTSLGSNVFVDNNNNGSHEANEPGLSGLNLEIYNTGSDGVAQNGDDVLVGEIQTDAEGNYFIGDLPCGDYYVRIPNVDVDFPASSSVTSLDPNDDSDNDDNGIQEAIGSDVRSNVISLSLGDEPTNEPGSGGDQDDTEDSNGNMTLDFGFAPLVGVGSTAFVDNNDNGLFDNDDIDDRLPGLTVQIFNLGLDGIVENSDDELVGTAVTNESGNYFIDGLVPGDYYISIPVLDADYPVSSTSTSLDPNDNVDNDDNGIQNAPGEGVWTNVITLTGNGETTNEVQPGGDQDATNDANGNMTVDFGFFASAEVGNFVFKTCDEFGVQNGSETPVEGANVSLTDVSGRAVTDIFGDPVADITTGEDGIYTFVNLFPGDYKVTFGLPASPSGLNFGPVDGAADDIDSDADPARGMSPVFTLVSSESRDDIDAGVIDVEDPTFTVPADLSVACDGDHSPAATGDVTDEADNCALNLEATFEDAEDFDQCGGEIIRTWTLVDDCGNETVQVQTITIEPADEPTITLPTLPATLACDEAAVFEVPIATYSNNIDGTCLIEGEIDPVVQEDFSICGGTITITYTVPAIGNCDRSGVEEVFVITVDPAPIPVITIPELADSFTCEEAVALVVPDATYSNGAADEVCLIAGEVMGVITEEFDECGGSFTITWTVESGCDESSVIESVTIPVTPAALPEITIPTLPSELTCDEAAAYIAPDASYSNCLLYTSPSPRDRTRSRMPSSA